MKELWRPTSRRKGSLSRLPLGGDHARVLVGTLLCRVGYWSIGNSGRLSLPAIDLRFLYFSAQHDCPNPVPEPQHTLRLSLCAKPPVTGVCIDSKPSRFTCLVVNLVVSLSGKSTLDDAV
jgi:hypothetical protein